MPEWAIGVAFAGLFVYFGAIYEKMKKTADVLDTIATRLFHAHQELINANKGREGVFERLGEVLSQLEEINQRQ